MSSIKQPEQQKVGSIVDANFPHDAEGRVYHVGVKKGEVANRVLSVGDPKRAELLAKLLDTDEKTIFKRASNRGYVVYTGKKNGVPISIIATGMGHPMMDFLVREVRAVVEGPMVIMRFGTCGTVDPAVKVGTIAVCAEAVAITRNVDAFSEEHENGATTTAARPATDFYYISRPVKPDPELHDMLKDELKAEMKTHGAEHDVIDGMNAQGDSFYGSQGRTDPNFIDHNETLIDELIAKYPKMTTLEMESFHLLHLGQVCKKPIKTAAATIILAQRKKGDFLPNDQIKKLEAIGGEACLRTLSKVQLDEAGLAEGIRLLFEEAGIEYKEERFTRADWYGSIKEKYQQSGISPYGQVPIVSYNGQHMPQSEAIIRYFANKNGLYGKNDEEQYKCDMIAAGTMDWRRSYVQLVYSDEFDKNLDLYVSQALAQWISNFEKLLSSVDNGENYFCGRELLFCDLLVFDLLELNIRLAAKCLDNAPKLAAFHKRVAARPRIAAYLASDRVPTKINNSGRG